jgi:hypothetical protein
MFYAKSTGGFYRREINGDNIPDDAVEITDAEYAALMAGQAQGKRILPGAGGVPTLQDPLQPSLAQQIAGAMRKIDADADAIYGAVLGNRGEEYKWAEADAKAYQTADYSGNAPAGVASWAAASGMTAQGAADDILATADAWRGAMYQIRSNRLARKKDVKAASNKAGIDAALSAWAGFVTAMRAALGI